VRRQRPVWSDVVLFELLKRTKPVRHIMVGNLSDMVTVNDAVLHLSVSAVLISLS